MGCFTHKELKESITGKQTEGISIKDDVKLRKKIIKAAKKGKRIQKDLNKALHLHLMDLHFYRQLQIDVDKRPLMPGRIMGIDFSRKSRRSRLYVRLEDPPMEIKVYGSDLAAQWKVRYCPAHGCFGKYGSTPEICPDEDKAGFIEDEESDVDGGDDDDDGSDYDDNEDNDDTRAPTFRAGEVVNILLNDYCMYNDDPRRNRWSFYAYPSGYFHT